jgi:hypothetical protein
MSKLLIVMAFMSMVILAVGTAFMPHDPIFMLASNSSSYEHLREVLASVLFIQLLTHPPRNIIFRLLAGTISLSVVVWAAYAVFTVTIAPLDMLSLATVAIAIGVTALEIRSDLRVPSAKLPSSKIYNPLIA